MIILNFLIYLLIGWIAICCEALIHIIVAEIKKLDWESYWKYNKFSIKGFENKARFIIGLTIWPIQFLRFLVIQKKLFNQYASK